MAPRLLEALGPQKSRWQADGEERDMWDPQHHGLALGGGPALGGGCAGAEQGTAGLGLHVERSAWLLSLFG